MSPRTAHVITTLLDLSDPLLAWLAASVPYERNFHVLETNTKGEQ
jgi:hypothetical protein